MMARLVKVLAMVAGLVPGAAVGVAEDAPLRWMPAYVEVLEAGDCVAALTILDKAEARGDPTAYFMDGTLHEGGRCVGRDLAKAVALYERAAPGADDAAIRLWAIHEYGLLGGVADPAAARHWAEVAARRLIGGGRAEAEARFRVIGNLQTPTATVAEALDAVFAVKARGMEAIHRQGHRYKPGGDGPDDPRAACLWLEHASEAGYAPASLELAEMYAFGQGVAPDANRAVLNNDRAAHVNAPGASLQAMRILLQSPVFERDAEEAYRALVLAERAGADTTGHRQVFEGLLSKEERLVAEQMVDSGTFDAPPVLRPRQRSISQPSCRIIL